MIKFSFPKILDLASAGRPGRSPVAWSRSTDSVDRRAQRARQYLAGGPVDRPGRPAESLLSIPGFRSIDRSTAAPTVRNLTVGVAVDRPDRPRPGYREQSLCPVDRPSSQTLACTLCTSVDRVGRPTSSCGRPSRSTGWSQETVFWD